MRIGISEQLKMAVLAFIMCLLTIPVVLTNSLTFTSAIVTVVCFAIFMFYCIAAIRRFLIFRQLDHIKFSSEEALTIQCRKVAFLFHPVSKHTSVILCVIVHDVHGNKFYYVYPLKSAPYDASKKSIKNQFTGNQVDVRCYRNTRFIKALF